MAERWYYLAQWDEPALVSDDPAAPDYAAPQGTVGLFDMRPLSAVEYGFFAADRQLTADDWTAIDNPDVHEFGDGTDLRNYHTSQSERDEWRSLLNLTASELSDADVDTLYDALWLTFRDCGDPDFANRFKPPTATSNGNVELHLGGHSLLARQGFTDLPKASQDRILEHVQNDMRRLVEDCRSDRAKSPPQDHYRKVATMWCRKYSLDTNKGKGQRRWHRLYPQSLRGNVGPPMEPDTTIGDDFTDTDGTVLANHNSTGSVGTTGWGWGGAGADDLYINSNSVTEYDTPDAARAEYDLSSSDNYAQIVAASENSDGVACRFLSTEQTYYFGAHQYNDGHIGKCIQGSRTEFDATSGGLGAGRIKIEADGTTITLYNPDGTVHLQATDSEISSGLRCGCGRFKSAYNIDFDDFEAADLAAGVSASFSMGASFGVSAQAQASAQASSMLAQSVGAGMDAAAASGADVPISHVESLSINAQASAPTDVALTATLDLSTQSDVSGVVEVAFTMDMLAGLAFEADAGAAVSTALGMASGLSMAGTAQVDEQISADLASQIQVSETVTAKAQVPLGVQATLATIADAVAQAGYTMDVVQTVTITGTTVQATLDLPDGRTIEVEAETRVFGVGDENRVRNVDDEKRIFEIE